MIDTKGMKKADLIDLLRQMETKVEHLNCQLRDYSSLLEWRLTYQARITALAILLRKIGAQTDRGKKAEASLKEALLIVSLLDKETDDLLGDQVKWDSLRFFDPDERTDDLAKNMIWV